MGLVLWFTAAVPGDRGLVPSSVQYTGDAGALGRKGAGRQYSLPGGRLIRPWP